MDDWVKQAACRGYDHLFFPSRGDNEIAEEAKLICARCPVKPECLDFVKHHPTMIGIWAGTTEKQRRGKKWTRADWVV